jgi:hypothetical protein
MRDECRMQNHELRKAKSGGRRAEGEGRMGKTFGASQNRRYTEMVAGYGWWNGHRPAVRLAQIEGRVLSGAAVSARN